MTANHLLHNFSPSPTGSGLIHTHLYGSDQLDTTQGLELTSSQRQSGIPQEKITALVNSRCFPMGSSRYVLPLTNQKTYTVSFSIPQLNYITPFSNNYVHVFLLCFSRHDPRHPVFEIPLTLAFLVQGICSGEGPCLYLSTTIGDFEFQCYRDSENNTSRHRDYSFWVSLLSFLGVHHIAVSDLFVVQLRCVGEGSFSRVVKAKHRFTSTSVVVKAIPKRKKLPHWPLTFQSTGQVEIDILRALNHEYIVKLYTAFEDEFHYYLVLEYLPGCNVYEWLQQHGHYTETQTREIMFRIFTALTVLESSRIVHRDVKLENLVIENPSDPTTVKLIDFGLGAFLCTPRIDMKCGSPGFVAPEIISKKPYGTAVDIFSAGVVLFCILTGTAPFYSHGDTRSMILNKNQDCRVHYTASIWKNISLEARDLLGKILDRNPHKRYTASQALTHCWMTRSPRTLNQSTPNIDFLNTTSVNDSEIISTEEGEESQAYSLASFRSQRPIINLTAREGLVHLPQHHNTTLPCYLFNETSVTRLRLLRHTDGQSALASHQSSITALAGQMLTQLLVPSLGTASSLSMFC